MKNSRVLISVVVALIAVAICIIAGIFLFQRLFGPTEIPEVATEVPPQATVPPTSGPEVDDSWDRIQSAGKIVVGTSADYPPFEFYTGESAIDGFDIALMDEIGRRLGVQIDYRDFAFDGLGGALQLGQIDLAIAAASVTPERQAVVDFSNTYFVGSDGVLALADSNLSIGAPGDLAAYKVGVQRASVYESWIQETLVDTGQMPSSNLFAYERAGDAVRDLEQQRLELVMLDLQPAEVAAAAGTVKLVGMDLNQQLYAIALPKGAASLKAEIDKVLTDLHNEGFIAQLAKQYLNIDPEAILPVPTPTPQPEATAGATSTPAPPQGCIDGGALVQHLTQEDALQPGQTFTKGWRVQNAGTCTWDTGYLLGFASGAKMGGEPVPVTRQVAPGDTYDFQVKLVAPLQPGNYQGIWQMYNAGNIAFGEKLKVNVQVVAGPTPTAVPTQVPPANISFAVDRDHIKQGECVTFNWKVANAQAVYFYAEGERWQDNGVTGEETRQECPPVTLTYYLRVVNQDNSVEVPQITIYVEAQSEAPYIKRFTVDPPDKITLGQCVNIQWEVEGAVTNVKITANDAALWDGAPTKATYEHCPDSAGWVAYGIEAAGAGGTSRAQQNVNVVEEAAATPVPPIEPDQPVIYSFSVTPNQVGAGECVDINWSAGGGTSHVRLLRNGDAIVDGGDLNGHGNDCLAGAGEYTYRLEAYNVAQDSTAQDQRVTVVEGGTDDPLANTRWNATALSDGSQMLDINGKGLLTNFGSGGAVTGYAGCNEYSGEYHISGNSLNISDLSKGSKGCTGEDERNALEAQFLANLAATASYNLEAGQLYLLDASNKVLIEYVPR